MKVAKRLILLFLTSLAVEARGVIAQDNARDKAPKSDRHEFVIANFKTEGGVTLPEARVVYGTYGKLNDAKDNAVVLPSH